MHIESTLISTAVAGVMGVASSGGVAYSVKKAKQEINKKPVLVGTASAFVFAAQMINFDIIGTGSSGHLGGGFLLATLLGAPLGFLAMCAILIIQCLFFSDGGLLALGCNIFNMGVIPCLVCYPVIRAFFYRRTSNKTAVFIGGSLGGCIAVLMGAMAVVLETFVSGIGDFSTVDFFVNMVSIHALIGIVEGLVTGSFLLIVNRLNTNMILDVAHGRKINHDNEQLSIVMGSAAVITAAILSIFASSYPDGLEWSLIRVAQSEPDFYFDSVHRIFHQVQTATTILPDYTIEVIQSSVSTSFSGLIGCSIVFGCGVLATILIEKRMQCVS